MEMVSKGTKCLIEKKFRLLRWLFHGGITMPNLDLLPSLLFKINENQKALEAAIMEITLWV